MALPRATAPNIDQRNENDVPISEKAMFEKIIPFKTLKDTILVESFNNDSPSIIRFNFLETENLLKTAATATASIEAAIDPKSNP